MDAQPGMAVGHLMAFENLDRMHTHSRETRCQCAAQPLGLDVVGVRDRERPFRAFVLSSPTRLVVDVSRG